MASSERPRTEPGQVAFAATVTDGVIVYGVLLMGTP